MSSQLPVPVDRKPHWRVTLRPAEYRPERLPTLAACFEAIAAAKVRLRGWDFPHLPNNLELRQTGNDHIAAWSDFMGHLEYWRFYQSGQFIELFAVREATESWAEQLRKTAASHYSPTSEVLKAPGFFSLLNFIYTVSEVFEFASRLCQHGTYDGPVEIDLRIRGALGFGLIPDWDRAWWTHYPLSSNDVGHAWLIDSAALVAASADHSLRACTWFFERFGWLDPPVDVLRRDQEKFLQGRL